MIIDSHVHIYPDKIAYKASKAIGDFYGIPMGYDGSVSRLLEAGGKAGIDRFLVHSVATTAHQVESINNFISSTVTSDPGKFIGFATMHPDYPDPERELLRITSLGLHGIKLHPDFQNFAINSKSMGSTYALCEKYRIPILFHTGDKRHNLSSPHLVLDLLDAFPDIKLICAHFGGWSEWDEALRCLPGTGVKVDTSSSFSAFSDNQILELIELYGDDNIFFGTDYPMWNPSEELKRFNGLNLPEKTQKKILSENLLSFLDIK